MITPRFLTAAADQMMRLYAELETAIKTDMCRRLAKLGKVTDATEWEAKILGETRSAKWEARRDKEKDSLNLEIESLLKKYDKATKKQVKELFQSLTEKNVPGEISDNQKQMMAATAGYKSLITDLSNLTRTSTATTEFIYEANKMYMKVASGAFSYDEAIKEAVDSMAAQGLVTLQYGNRAHSIESIARTCVITTLGQTAANQSIQNAEETETDLVMVSAHEGARHTDNPANPWSNHDEWQGKVYCLSGERDWKDSEGNIHHAPNFHDACGYGEVDGICGINCRHTFYPFYEGENPRYEDEELKEYTAKNLELDGKMVSRYEAEQAMRKCERGIRAWKRKADCLEAAGLDNTAARVKIGEWQAARRSISKQTGIPPDYAREYIGKVPGIFVGKAKPITSIDDLKTMGKDEKHSIQDDAKNTNPNFDPDNFGYSNNCQRCCVAYELRRRNKDVIAAPCEGNTPKEIMRDKLAEYKNNGFASMYKNPEILQGFTENGIKNEMINWGEGARAEIYVFKPGSAFGHTFMAEVSFGKVYFVDPQSGKSLDGKIFNNTLTDMTKFFRTDDLQFNDNMIKCVKNRKSNDQRRSNKDISKRKETDL